MAKDIYKVEDRDGSGASGTITYDPDSKQVEIDLDLSEKRKKELQSFFTTEREFWIPESEDRIDDYREEIFPPIVDSDHFRMAMSELYGATGIYVL